MLQVVFARRSRPGYNATEVRAVCYIKQKKGKRESLMSNLIHSRKATWISLVSVLLLALLAVILSPAEQMLGAAVKWVYVHVAFSRAGGIGFIVTGLVGVVVFFTGNELLSGWMRSIGWVSLALFIIGFLISIIAQAASWNGIAWREPRVSGALNVLAVAVIVQILNAWLNWVQGRGALRVLLAAFVLWTELRAENILHPGDAISASGSAGIVVANWVLLACALLLGVWGVWQLRLRAELVQGARADQAAG